MLQLAAFVNALALSAGEAAHKTVGTMFKSTLHGRSSSTHRISLLKHAYLQAQVQPLRAFASKSSSAEFDLWFAGRA
jgi:hypothetical protein